MTKGRILVCDDEEDTVFLMQKQLEKAGYQVETCMNGLACVEAYTPEFDLVLLDLNMPRMDGLEVLAKILTTDPEAVVVMVTSYSSLEQAVTAMKLGAKDYMRKPFKTSYLLATVEEAIQGGAEPEATKSARKGDTSRKLDISSESPAMQKIADTLNKITDKNISVVIGGESGTGKEVLAKKIHESSDRSSQAFVAVNCPAIPETLVESILFGHKKGSFTGATENRVGKFELAHKGTLFLDEIGDLSMENQAKILRVLQEREIDPLGASKSVPIDVRVICASSKNLRIACEEGRFRTDLFYRLADIELSIPPLRERKEDIIDLAVHFINEYAKENKEKPKKLNHSAASKLVGYEWPGNVRELRSIIRRICIMTSGEGIDKGSITDEYLLRPSQSDGFQQMKPPQEGDTDSTPSNVVSLPLDNRTSLADSERQQIEAVLQETDFNVSKAAKILNIGRATLYRKIKKYKITG